jgi:polysaccharide biosynthesis transport protein
MKHSSEVYPSHSQNSPQAIFLREDASNSAPADVPTGGLLEYWRILQRRKNTVIVIALVGMIAGFLCTVPQTPIYQARTVIEIQGLNSAFLNMKDVDPNSDQSGYDPTIEVQTQVHILQSNALLERVTRKVAAVAKNSDPHPTRLQAWRKLLHIPGKAMPTDSASKVRSGVSNLKVRAEPNTRLIEILCDSPDPSIAAAFANTLTSEFIEQSLEARWQTTQHTGEFLTNQMQDIKIKLEQSEDAMQSYARDNNLVITDEKNNAEEIKLSQLQEELSKAQADRIQRQSDFELARRAPVESIGEIIDDASLKETQGTLTGLRRQYAELSSTLTPANPRSVKVQAQIASLVSALEQQRGNILGRIRNDFESAQRRENLLAAQYGATASIVAAQADKITHYNTLKREVNTNRQLSDSILQRVKEASVASALRASNIHVVDPATVPKSPYKPSILNNTVLGLLAGILFGIAFVVFIERADRTIQEPGDTAFYLGVPELGIIPCASVDPTRSRKTLSIASQLASVTSREMALTTLESKPSAIAESFRATLTSILFSGENGTHPQVLVVSSASPKEGKTTLTTNLAVALAEIHKKVLLIDADLRRPSIHRFFNLKKDTGMVDLLRRAEPIVGPFNGHVRPSGVTNLSIMTSGHSEDGDPTLLHSKRLAELIELARLEYDVVLIDTPPMLNMSDARIIARQSDGVVLVVRANVTSRDSIKDAHRLLVEDGARVIGAVLNDWNPKTSSRYSYYRYYDRYRHYYGEAKS